MKKNIPVTKLMPKPMSPNGSSRCTEANDIPRSQPSSRRLTIISTPNMSDMPMKCSVSHVGHTNGCCRTKSLIAAADRNGAPGEPREEPGDLHHDEGAERRVVMRHDRGSRHARLPLERLGGRLAADVHGQRQERDQEDDLEADLLDVIVFPDERHQQKTQTEN